MHKEVMVPDENEFSDEHIRRSAALELAKKFNTPLDLENVQAIEDFLSTIDTQFDEKNPEEHNLDNLKNGVKDFLRLDPNQRLYRYGLAVKNSDQGTASIEDEIIIAIAEHNDSKPDNPDTQESTIIVKKRIQEIENMMDDKDAYPIDSPQRNAIALERQKLINELDGLEIQLDKEPDNSDIQPETNSNNKEHITEIQGLLDKLKEERDAIEVWDENKLNKYNKAIANIVRLLHELENSIEPTVSEEEITKARALVNSENQQDKTDNHKETNSEQEKNDIAEKNKRRKRWWEIHDRLIEITNQLKEIRSRDKDSEEVRKLIDERISLEAEQTKLAEGLRDIDDSRDDLSDPKTRMTGTAEVTNDSGDKVPSKEIDTIPIPIKEIDTITEKEPTPEALEQWVFGVGAQTDTLERVAVGAMTEIHHEHKELGNKKWFNPSRWIKSLKFNPMVKKITTEGRAFKMIKRIRGATNPDGAATGVDFASTVLGITVDQAEAEEQAVVGAVLDAALRRPGDKVQEFDGSEQEPPAVAELRQKVKELVFEHIENTQDYNAMNEADRVVADGLLKDKFNDYYAQLIKQNPELFTEHSLLVLSSNILKIASQTRAVLAAVNGMEQAEQRLDNLKINIGDIRAGQESLSEIDPARLEKALDRMREGKVASVLGKQIAVSGAFAGALLATTGLSYAAGEIASRGILAGTKWGATTVGSIVLGPVGAVAGFGIGVAATGMLSRHFVAKGHKESIDDLAHVKGTESKAEDIESYVNVSAEQAAEAMLSVMDIPLDSDGNELYDQATLRPNMSPEEIEQAMRLLASHDARRALEVQAEQNGEVMNLYYSKTLVGIQKLNFAETKLKSLLETAYLRTGIPTGQVDPNGQPVTINYANAMQTIYTERLTTFKYQQDEVDEVRKVVDKKVKRLGLVLGGAGSALGSLGSALAMEAISSGASPTILDTFGDLGKEAFTLGNANTMFDNFGSSKQPSSINSAQPSAGNSYKFSTNFNTINVASGEVGIKLPDGFSVDYSAPDANGTYTAIIKAPDGTSPFGGADVTYISIDKSGSVDPASMSKLNSWGFTSSEVNGQQPITFANHYDALMAHPTEISNGYVSDTAWLDNGSPNYSIGNAASLIMDSKSDGSGAVFSINSQGQSWNASGLAYDPVELANKGELFFAIRAQAPDGSMVMVKVPALVGPDGTITGTTSGWEDALFHNNPNGGPPIGATVNLAIENPNGGIISFAEVTGTDTYVDIPSKVTQLTPNNVLSDSTPEVPVPKDSAVNSSTPGYAIPPLYVPNVYPFVSNSKNSETDDVKASGPVNPAPLSPKPKNTLDPNDGDFNTKIPPASPPSQASKDSEQQAKKETKTETKKLTLESDLKVGQLYLQAVYTDRSENGGRILKYIRKDNNGNHIFEVIDKNGNNYTVNAGTWETLTSHDGWVKTDRLRILLNSPKSNEANSTDSSKTKTPPVQSLGSPNKGQSADASTNTAPPFANTSSQSTPEDKDREELRQTLTDIPVVALPGEESLNQEDITVELPQVKSDQILIGPDGKRCIVVGVEQDKIRVKRLDDEEDDATQPIYDLPINTNNTDKTKEVGANNRKAPADAPLIDGTKLIINQVYSYRTPGTREKRDKVFMGYIKGKDGKQGKYLFKDVNASDSDPNSYLIFNDSSFNVAKQNFRRVGETIENIEGFKTGYFLVPPGKELFMGANNNLMIKIKSIENNIATIEYFDPYGKAGETKTVSLEELIDFVSKDNLRLVSEQNMRWVPEGLRFGLDSRGYNLAA